VAGSLDVVRTKPSRLLTNDAYLLQSEIPSNIPKRMRRILANRASAARSKERKKAIVELEEQVAELQQQRQAHEGSMHELRTSNATLGATGWWLGLCEVNPAALSIGIVYFRALLTMLCQATAVAWLGLAWQPAAPPSGRVLDQPPSAV